MRSFITICGIWFLIKFFPPQTYTITDTVQKIAESYDCKPIEGMLSHQLEQNRIDGEKTIIQVRAT